MPVSPPPLVSILVCTFNRDRLLPGALRSLLAQTGIDQDATEIIVVDDGSTDATQRIIAELQRDSPIRIVAVTGAHVGLGAARNLAVSHARGAWLAFFDDDQIADPCWLAALLASASAAQVDGVGGRTELRFLEARPAEVTRTVRRLLSEKRGATARRVQWRREAVPGMTIPATSNALVRSALLARLGGFRPEVNYGEDAEFFRRARRAGARFAYSDAARVEHLIPPERLRLAYLLSLARRAGAAAAWLDLEDLGAPAVAGECALRVGHALVFKLPALLSALARRHRPAVHGHACSLAYSWQYCADAARHGVARAVGRRPAGSVRAGSPA